jgi:hypothetical protein
MQHEHIKHRTQRLGLKGGDLAALVSSSPSKLSEFFRGRRTLDPVKVKEIVAILDDIERLKEYFPVPIGTHDPKLLALTIERLRSGRFESFRGLMPDWAGTDDELNALKKQFPKIFKSQNGEE